MDATFWILKMMFYLDASCQKPYLRGLLDVTLRWYHANWFNLVDRKSLLLDSMWISGNAVKLVGKLIVGCAVIVAALLQYLSSSRSSNELRSPAGAVA